MTRFVRGDAMTRFVRGDAMTHFARGDALQQNNTLGLFLYSNPIHFLREWKYFT